jgi:hypothetical protein
LFLLARGSRAFRAAGTAFVQATIEIGRAVSLPALPYAPDPLSLESREATQTRLDRWRDLHLELRSVASASPLPGEEAARLALHLTTDAHHDLATTELARLAHVQLHRVGEFVGALYGCWHGYDDGVWFETCPVRLAHIPLGSSPGFVARRLCSICKEDISECVHMPDRPYRIVTSRDDDGRCTVCGYIECDHAPGSTQIVYQHMVPAEATLLEASITPNPREPRARITAVELDPQPSPPRTRATRLRCITCLLPCAYSRSADAGPVGTAI